MSNGGQQHPNNPPPSNGGGGDDITKVGALADGFANTATNATEIDDGSSGNVGTANGNFAGNGSGNSTTDSNNDNSKTVDNDTTNTDNSQDNDTSLNAQVDVAVGNGNDRDNTSYDNDTDNSKTINVDDSYTKTVNISDNDNITKTSYDNDYTSKVNSDNTFKSSSDDDVENSNNASNSNNDNSQYWSDSSSHSFNLDKGDDDFADLDNIANTGNFGVAGKDLTFNLGDDFSFTLDVKDFLNHSLNGEGNDSGFSAIQANHLADQDYASSLTMDNQHADNYLNATGGSATGAEGVDMDAAWNTKVGDDLSGNSTADASAIVANSGFHMELVQGANMLSNAVDATIAGHDVSDVGQDTAGS